MGLETSTTLTGLNELWPLGTDPRSEGDNHLRLLKSVIKLRFDDSVAGRLQLKDRWSVGLYQGTVNRGDWFSDTGASAIIGITARNNAGVRKSEMLVRENSHDYLADGNVTYRILDSAGAKTRVALTWVLANGYIELATYDPTTGARVGYIGVDSSDQYMSARSYQRNILKAAGGVADYAWYSNAAAGTASGYRTVTDGAGDTYYEWVDTTAALIARGVSLARATGNFHNYRGSYTLGTLGSGYYVNAAGGAGGLLGNNVDGWGTGTGPLNNVELHTWFGWGVRCTTDGGVRFAVNSRTGETKQQGTATIGSSIHQTDGNIQFAGSMVAVVQAGTLAEALVERAFVNDQTGANSTGYQLGTVLVAQLGALSPVRNATYGLTLNNANSGLFVVSGQPNAGTPLDGIWRYQGLASSGNGLFTRVPS